MIAKGNKFLFLTRQPRHVTHIGKSGKNLDGEKITDAKLVVPVGAEHVFQVGKRKFAKVKIKP
jgi:hypothetical protein